MNKRALKGLLFTALGTCLCVPFVAFTTTSCSATPAPYSMFDFNTGGNHFRVDSAGGIIAPDGVVINGQSFTSAPSLDNNNPNTYYANSEFSLVNNVANWAYTLATSVSQLISRAPATKNQPTNLINVPTSVSASGLDYALSAYLGSGANTYRLGITSIDLGSDIIAQSLPILRPAGPGPGGTTQPSTTGSPVSVSSMTINFGWWKSNGGNSTSIISQSDFDNVNKDAFNEAIVPPKMTYSLTFKPFSFSLYPSFTKDSDGSYYYTGSFTMVDQPVTYRFSGLDGTSDNLYNLTDDINALNNAANGDTVNETFAKMVGEEQGQFVNQNLNKLLA